MIINFEGPFSWLGDAWAPSVFHNPVGKKYGIYLWTIPYQEGDLVYYVGETWRSFEERLKEHLKEYLAGMYDIFDLEEFLEARKKVLWNGMWRPGEEKRMNEFLARHDSLWPHLQGIIQNIRFHLAPLNVEKRFLERVEGAIASCLYEADGIVGEFQETGIRYRPRRDDEEPVTVSIRTQAPIAGLPSEIVV